MKFKGKNITVMHFSNKIHFLKNNSCSKRRRKKPQSDTTVMQVYAYSAWCSVKHQREPGGRYSQEWRRQHCGAGCLPLSPHGVGRHWHQRRRRSWPHCRGTAHLAGNLCAGHPRIYYHHHRTMILQNPNKHVSISQPQTPNNIQSTM